MSKKFDRYQFNQNKQEAANRLKEQFGVKKDEVQALLASGLQGIQDQMYKLEAIMQPEDLALATELSTGSVSQSAIDSKTVGFSPERKKLITSLLLMMFLFVFLVGCAAPTEAVAPTTNAPTVTEVSPAGIETVIPGETDVVIAPTEVVEIEPTFTPTATEVVEVSYFDMSPEQRLAESEDFVEAASQYSGEVTWYANGDSKLLLPWYWSFDQEWKTTESADSLGLPLSKLDIYGETLPEQTIPGWENPDGSLVMVRDGVETTFPAEIFVPGLGNVSMRDLMTMGQDRLSDEVIDQLQTIFNPEASDAEKIQYDRLNGQREWANFIPGFYVNSYDIFPLYLPNSSSPTRDVEGYNGIKVGERPTSEFVVPIFSPETGDFMFFLNIQKASLSQSLGFEYSSSGAISADTLSTGGETAAFQNGEFAILIENKDPESTHLSGGDTRVIGDGDPGIGEAPSIETILNARTEQEIIDALNETRIIFSIAGRIYYPDN